MALKESSKINFLCGLCTINMKNPPNLNKYLPILYNIGKILIKYECTYISSPIYNFGNLKKKYSHFIK